MILIWKTSTDEYEHRTPYSFLSFQWKKLRAYNMYPLTSVAFAIVVNVNCIWTENTEHINYHTELRRKTWCKKRFSSVFSVTFIFIWNWNTFSVFRTRARTSKLVVVFFVSICWMHLPSSLDSILHILFYHFSSYLNIMHLLCQLVFHEFPSPNATFAKYL